MLQTYVIPTLQQRVCLQEIIFMHDGSPLHNVRSVQQLDRRTTCELQILPKTAWPPRSPDLTPCDFWL
ncbi:hypothetical protein TNCV_4528481 [Trichonephila clavipes]|nr:hypothetical protein TNCV_4528481 [Trichonephila clavipes]